MQMVLLLDMEKCQRFTLALRHWLLWFIYCTIKSFFIDRLKVLHILRTNGMSGTVLGVLWMLSHLILPTSLGSCSHPLFIDRKLRLRDAQWPAWLAKGRAWIQIQVQSELDPVLSWWHNLASWHSPHIPRKHFHTFIDIRSRKLSSCVVKSSRVPMF